MKEQRFDSTSMPTSALAHDLRELICKLRRRMREQTQLGDLTWSQVAVLRRLKREGPSTVTSLARAEGMRPQSMGSIISALEAAGFVKGDPDPNDRRQTILSLTEKCHEWTQSVRTAREDWLFHAIQAEFSAEEQEQLISAVGLLKRLVEA